MLFWLIMAFMAIIVLVLFELVLYAITPESIPRVWRPVIGGLIFVMACLLVAYLVTSILPGSGAR